MPQSSIFGLLPLLLTLSIFLSDLIQFHGFKYHLYLDTQISISNLELFQHSETHISNCLLFISMYTYKRHLKLSMS